jgi:hypothetical protein
MVPMVARQPTGLKLLRQVGLNDQVQRPLSETNACVKNPGEGVVAKEKQTSHPLEKYIWRQRAIILIDVAQVADLACMGRDTDQ